MRTKHLPSTPGIYSIKNKVNGKIYIGSSNNIQKRARKHLQLLRKGNHSQHLQNAWNLYGENNFEILVLALCSYSSGRENLIALEQKFLDDCRPFHGENGYNSSIEAKRCVHTNQSKEKLKQSNIGEKILKRNKF